jgi:heme/copper-type cytochrome/quinol oxidase subunit 2
MLIPFVLLGLAVLLVPLAKYDGSPTTHEVTVKASQFTFDPPVLHVNRGDRVVLTLEATDVVHGLYLDEYGINIRAEPGTSRRVEFVADRAGEFRYRCSVSCGNLHPFMIGELVVAPNEMYWRATALTLIAVTATLFRLWPRQERATVHA